MRIILKPGGVFIVALAFFTLVVSVYLFAMRGAGTSRAAIDAPSVATFPQSTTPVTQIEAEQNPLGEVRTDPGASGGKYVHVTGDYQPLLRITVPATGGDTFTVWARLRATAAELKGINAVGKQTDFEWNWERPAAWQWVRLGRHTRAELGNEIQLIRSTDDNRKTNDGVDAVLFAPDDALNPNQGL